MSDPWVPPTDVKVTCNLCGEQIVGVEQTIDHLRVMHPDDFEEPQRWPDGGVVFDVDPDVIR